MKPVKRTRLSPHDRRMQLLDCAKVIVQDSGLSGFTMDALATAAGVSNPLIYKYFDTRLVLLQELLEREYRGFFQRIEAEVKEVSTLEEVVTIYIRLNFEEASRGNILNILREQADVREAIHDIEVNEARHIGLILIDGILQIYDVSPKQAERLVRMGAGAAQAAAEDFVRIGGDQQVAIRQAVDFVFGGIDAAIHGFQRRP